MKTSDDQNPGSFPRRLHLHRLSDESMRVWSDFLVRRRIGCVFCHDAVGDETCAHLAARKVGRGCAGKISSRYILIYSCSCWLGLLSVFNTVTRTGLAELRERSAGIAETVGKRCGAGRQELRGRSAATSAGLRPLCIILSTLWMKSTASTSSAP